MRSDTIRPYDSDRDHAACLRILEEIGWGLGDAKDNGPLFERYTSDCDVLVAELEGEAESWAICRKAWMRYLDVDLPVGFITGVGTSRIARGRGLALAATAHSIAQSASSGATVARLGIFDQGFYDKLGFGTLAYVRLSTIDPRNLSVPKLNRSPIRLSAQDASELHDCRMRRMRWHGACSLVGAGATECEMLWEKTQFGLGFRGDDGNLTHCMVLKPKGENGPYSLEWLAYESPEQFIELLSVLKSLGDQVHGVTMREPAHVQLQDMLEAPFRTYLTRKGSTFAVNPRSNAYEQARILDLEKCVEAVRLPGETVRFNLVLEDRVAHWLPEDADWRGLGGS
ncbi:MAG: GNAT family N-acetyltransferase [Phycisphaerales bacterium]|nr:GNAT family N-acetyltransferase [Phycisphaerales bacterium]